MIVTCDFCGATLAARDDTPTSAEFPREHLLQMIEDPWCLHEDETALTEAINAYGALSDRCVMDATEASLEIGKLRAANVALQDRLDTLEADARNP